MVYRKNTRFGGAVFIYPGKGDRVRIREGEFVGASLVVIDIYGCVYDNALKIHVLSPEGEELWYWPWNVEIETDT